PGRKTTSRPHCLRRPRPTRKGIRPTAETCDPHSLLLLLLLRRPAHGFWRHWILVMFRQRGIHEIPRLRVTGPHVPRGLKPTRIVQALGVTAAQYRGGSEIRYEARYEVLAASDLMTAVASTRRHHEISRV